MMRMESKLMVVLALVVLSASVAIAGAAPPAQQRTMDKVHKELVTLPYFGVFDNLAYKVEGDTVTLYGQVRNQFPTALPRAPCNSTTAGPSPTSR